MLTVYLENIGAADLPIPQGSLAVGANTTVSLDLLLRSSYYQSLLAGYISAGDLIAKFNNNQMNVPQMENLQLTVAQLNSTDNDPHLDQLDIAGTGAIAAIGGQFKVIGRNFRQGNGIASVHFVEGGADLGLYSLKPGKAPFTAELIQGAGASGIAYNPVTFALVIDIGVAGDSDDNLATLVNADVSPCKGLIRANSVSGGSFTAPQAEEPFTDGNGNWEGYKVMVNGIEALPKNEPGATSTAKWNDTDILCSYPGGGGAATDEANIEVEANGLKTSSLSTTLV